MLAWTEVDKAMEREYTYPKSLDLRIKIISVVMMLAGIVQHIAYLIRTVPRLGRTVREDFELFYKEQFRTFANLIDYNPFLLFILQVGKMSCYSCSKNKHKYSSCQGIMLSNPGYLTTIF